MLEDSCIRGSEEALRAFFWESSSIVASLMDL